MTPADVAATRPRVEGDREQEILTATLTVLADVGYDRLTMDAVAGHARASKATLYRRWNGKVALVIDALNSQKAPLSAPDTGTLRGDLVATFCGMGGLTDGREMAVLASVVTAIARDAEFAKAFREKFIAPKAAIGRSIYERALGRGEIREDADLDIITPALPAIVLHRQFLLGDVVTRDLIIRVIDQVVLPAVLKPHLLTSPDPQSPDSQSPDPQSPDSQSPDPQSPDPQSPDPQSPDPQSPDPSRDHRSRDHETKETT